MRVTRQTPFLEFELRAAKIRVVPGKIRVTGGPKWGYRMQNTSYMGPKVELHWAKPELRGPKIRVTGAQKLSYMRQKES
jgi:hypothetical protein